MAIRVGLKPLMTSLFGDSGAGTAIRYFIVALIGGAVWPMTFRFWAKLGRPNNDKRNKVYAKMNL